MGDRKLYDELSAAYIRTAKAWDKVLVVINQPFNVHRREICQEYLAAAREESRLTEEFARKTGLVPVPHLPLELYYLYYPHGSVKRKRWEEFCRLYEETGETDYDILKDKPYNPWA